MELRDVIAVFRNHRRIFWTVVLFFVISGLAWQHWQRTYVVGDLTLNVTRSGSEKTMNYQYHDFYRLQADERFADTVVRWLESPRMTSDIYRNALGASKQAFGGINAERLSSQMIRVTYKADDESEAKRVAKSIVAETNKEADLLDKDQQEQAWFIVVGDEPVIRDGRKSFGLVLTVSLALGLFIGFWSVLIRHYFSGNTKY